MNVLVIGATGYVGTAVDEALVARGHRTTATARSDIARVKLQARGTSFVVADAAKPKTLIEHVQAADAVIYAMQATDADPWLIDLAAMRTIARAMAGTERTFVYVSGAWVYGNTDGLADENATLAPPALVARRPELEHFSRNMVKIGIRGHVVRPGIVYGNGGGIPAMFVQSARERQASTMVGDGKNYWATIARADLGRLISLVIERGKPGAVYNAVDDRRFTVAQIAQAASRGAGAGGRTTIVPPEILGPFGECLFLDQQVSNARAKAELGWTPSAPSILEELECGSYTTALLAS